MWGRYPQRKLVNEGRTPRGTCCRCGVPVNVAGPGVMCGQCHELQATHLIAKKGDPVH